MYSSTVSLTSTLDVGGWSRPRPGGIPPGRTRYPLYMRLRVRKISPPPGFDPRTVQSVASRCTDYRFIKGQTTDMVWNNFNKYKEPNYYVDKNSSVHKSICSWPCHSRFLVPAVECTVMVQVRHEFYNTRHDSCFGNSVSPSRTNGLVSRVKRHHVCILYTLRHIPLRFKYTDVTRCVVTALN